MRVRDRLDAAILKRVYFQMLKLGRCCLISVIGVFDVELDFPLRYIKLCLAVLFFQVSRLEREVFGVLSLAI